MTCFYVIITEDMHPRTHLVEMITVCVLHWTFPQPIVVSSVQLLLSILQKL